MKWKEMFTRKDEETSWVNPYHLSNRSRSRGYRKNQSFRLFLLSFWMSSGMRYKSSMHASIVRKIESNISWYHARGVVEQDRFAWKLFSSLKSSEKKLFSSTGFNVEWSQSNFCLRVLFLLFDLSSKKSLLDLYCLHYKTAVCLHPSILESIS